MTIHDLWERVFPAEKRWLGVVIVSSLGVHVLVMLLFDVRWPSASRFPVRAEQATLILSGGSWSGVGAESLEPWLRWRDPSVIAMPRSPLPDVPLMEELQPVADRWSLPDEVAGFDPLVDTDGRDTLNEEVAEALLPDRASPEFVPVVAPPPLSGTRVQWHGALGEREVVKRTELPRPETTESLKVTVVMVGVRPDGGVDSVFVEESSMDSSVDADGVRALRQWRFAPVDETGITYGQATIYWDLAPTTEMNQPMGPYTF